ncbi:MAG: vanadium-dependent haloperoxidase [Aggregatilineales bacterium]
MQTLLCRRLLVMGMLMCLLAVPLTLSAQDEIVPATELESTLANDWMMLLYELVRDETINAPMASRFYAYAAVALYEGVAPGIPGNFSLSSQLEGLAMLPFPEEGVVYDYASIANASLSTMITALFEAESGTDATFERIDMMREMQTAARLEDGLDEVVVERSLVLGDEIGEELKLWMATLDYDEVRGMSYDLLEGDLAYWVPTSEGMEPLEPFWGELFTFGMGFPSQCNVAMRMPFSSDPDSTFYKQAAEVLDVSDELTDEQREIARFWIDTPGITGAPSGHWVLIQMQLAQEYELSLARASEMYVLVGMAMNDAFISAWNLKYRDNLVRPVTYIQRNLRRNWTPYVESPPFPEYPSGHSVVSGAASEVLTTMFGQIAFTDRTPLINGHENFQRAFTSFEAAAYEAAISRLYGGIHYRAAIENGLEQGHCVGENVLRNMRLRPRPQGE